MSDLREEMLALADELAGCLKQMPLCNPNALLNRVERGLRSAARTGPDVAHREAIAQALLDRFIERCNARIQGSPFPRGTKINTLVHSYRDDFLADADAAIAALPAPAGESVTGWQPIATAPKDGRYIIAGRFRDDELKWVKHSRWMSAEEACEEEGGSSADDYDAGWTDGEDEHDYCCPTHWMTLPTITRKSEARS